MMPAWHSNLGWLIFLCFPLRGILSVCTTESDSECRTVSFVPGSRLAGDGYDVVTLQPKGAFVIDVNTWRFTNGSCTLCDNGHLSNVRQRLPVSLVDWRTMSSCQRSLSSQLYHSAAKLSESATSAITNDWQADLLILPEMSTQVNWVLAGSKSKLVTFGTTHSKRDRHSFSSHQFQCLYYQYRVKENPKLAPEFANSISRLPDIINDDTIYWYRKLVATYGTHYIKAVELGGSFKDVTAIPTCQVASKGYTAEEVKDCLSMEASVMVGLIARGSFSDQKCRQMARAMKHHDNVYQAFSDREVELNGGQTKQSADLLFNKDGSAFTQWMVTLPTHPGMVRYALAPLHHLLPKNDPRHKNLRRYISYYIAVSALNQQCGMGTQCPHGSYRDPHQPCTCMCHEDSHVDRNCCSKEKGLGHLVVIVLKGQGLWADYFSAADSFVVVKYGQKSSRTFVSYDNNNPVWNEKLDLGHVNAESSQNLIFEVWDVDVKYDDLLGTCKDRLTSGEYIINCPLHYGSVSLFYSFTCGPHLDGETCQYYKPRPAN
ncbi:perforin-1-like [Chiloscyllium plagiosum]|uniref:perforin-1-like n=1 Tax=Chiloscyllium plagiosum TaxID=36176 RepID=UPI001CB80FD4|nr:perforin-1-like [Chiloscyllium plagiosum]XP_043542569.1 perforin-1-like [Chiloscyllium plagiosum]XP_043542570.1 perforin-1-like [Chiloscyllium plagiosum]